MKNVFTTCLTILLVFANVACVCASPVSEVASDPHAHHDVHHDVHHELSHSGTEEVPDCLHQDCDGDCSQTFVRATDRDSSPKLCLKSEGLDDPDFVEVVSLTPDIQFTHPETKPPPYILYLTAVTPVQRKDILLN